MPTTRQIAEAEESTAVASIGYLLAANMSMRRTILLPLFAFSMLLVSGGNATGEKVKMTGCLTKAPTGEYLLTSPDGKKVFVSGSVDLDKHAANHKVTVHGTEKTTDGKTIFQVEKLDHVSNSCEAPTAQ